MSLHAPDLLRWAALGSACWLGLAGGGLAAVEDPDRPEVIVDGIRLTPRGNLGNGDGRHVLHPKGLLGLGYDSNVSATADDPTGDVWWRLLAGVEGRYSPSFFDVLTYDLNLTVRSWAQERDRDLIGGNLDLAWEREGLTLQTTTSLHWARLRDPLIQSGSEVERSELGAAWRARAEGATTIRTFGLLIETDDYHDATSSFSRDSRDNARAEATAALHFLRSETSRLSIAAALAMRRYRNDEDFNDSWTGEATLAWRGRIGDRSLLAIEGGLQYRHYADDFRGDDAYDDRGVIVPLANLLLRWDYADESVFDLMCYSRATDSLSSNAAWIAGLRLDTRFPITRRLDGELGLNIYQVLDSGSADGVDTERRQTLALHGQLVYALREGLSCRLRLGHTDSRSRVGQDFDRFEARLELAAAF